MLSNDAQCCLYEIDGLPGAGKSTSSEWLAIELEREGRTVHLFREREPGHPLNVGGDLHPSGNVVGDELFASYSVGQFIDESFSRWQKFVHWAQDGEKVCILDSYPFQNSVRVLFQMDAEQATLYRYFFTVEEIARPLAPRLIFFDTGEPGRQLREIARHRGPDWTEAAVAIVTHCPYAEARGLHGLDGAVEIMRDYADLMRRLLGRTNYPALELTGCNGDWPRCLSAVRDFAGFPGCE